MITTPILVYSSLILKNDKDLEEGFFPFQNLDKKFVATLNFVRVGNVVMWTKVAQACFIYKIG